MVMHNQHCNEVRRKVREGSSAELDQTPTVPVQSNAIAVLELRDLERAINGLPEDQRTVVLLIGLEEMQYDRVAEILKVPVGTVRSRLARGRAKLRRLMSAGQAVQAQPAFAPGRRPVTVRPARGLDPRAFPEMTRRTVVERLAFRALAREGITAIWHLHVAAAQADAGGRLTAAAMLIEIADAVEREWRLAAPSNCSLPTN
jgi:hypothetical protein